MRKEFLFKGQRLIQDEVHTPKEFFDFMSSLKLKPPFIVKPNWGWTYTDYGCFIDPQILEWTLRSFDKLGEVVLVESYNTRRKAMSLPNFNLAQCFLEPKENA